MEKLEKFLTAAEVQQKINELAKQINQDYAGKQLLVIGILRGAFIFMADLVRRLEVPVTLDFVAVSSYGEATVSSGVVRILKDLDESVAGRHVLLVEDIIDTGLTLNYMCDYIKGKGPASLKVCALLDKPDRRKINLHPEYVGFKIPDYFVVGYGLDCGGRYRNLPDIYIYHQELEPGEEGKKKGSACETAKTGGRDM